MTSFNYLLKLWITTWKRKQLTWILYQPMQAEHVFEGIESFYIWATFASYYLKLGHTGRIFSIALCTLADGRKVAASASHDRTVRLWCLTTFQHIRTLTYTDFVWRVFIVINPSTGKPYIVAYVSTEDKIQVI